jgi:hypothetical protein
MLVPKLVMAPWVPYRARARRRIHAAILILNSMINAADGAGGIEVSVDYLVMARDDMAEAYALVDKHWTQAN